MIIRNPTTIKEPSQIARSLRNIFIFWTIYLYF